MAATGTPAGAPAGAPAVTKCDIIRDAARATKCGMCSALAAGTPLPAACFTAGAAPPAAACGVAASANARMRMFATRLSPANLYEGSAAQTVRAQTERILQGISAANEIALTAAYTGPGPSGAARAVAPGATAISWPDFEACLW